MQGDLSPRTIGDFGGMRNHDDRVTIAMKAFEQRQNLVAGAAIQCAGRFVGQDESGIVHHRAGDDNPLLLSSRELIRPMMTAVSQAYAVKRILGRATSFGARNAGVNKRKFDIFQRGCPRQKRWELEYEADGLGS